MVGQIVPEVKLHLFYNLSCIFISVMITFYTPLLRFVNRVTPDMALESSLRGRPMGSQTGFNQVCN